MWDSIKSVLKQYVGSKKAIATFAAIAAWVAGKAGLGLDTAELIPAISPLWLYVVALAFEDHGKAAKASAVEAMKPRTVTVLGSHFDEKPAKTTEPSE